jgi:hypothetical protein
MKRIKIAVLAVMAAVGMTALGADFKAPFHESITFTNTSVVILPAVPTNARPWVANAIFTNGQYIYSTTNSATRYLLALNTGVVTNTAPNFMTTTNIVDLNVTFRPVCLERQAYVICNDGTNIAYLAFGKDAVANKGIRLAPGAIIRDEFINNSFWLGEITGISTGVVTTNTLTIMQR